MEMLTDLISHGNHHTIQTYIKSSLYILNLYMLYVNYISIKLGGEKLMSDQDPMNAICWGKFKVYPQIFKVVYEVRGIL